jgi:nitroreductase
VGVDRSGVIAPGAHFGTGNVIYILVVGDKKAPVSEASAQYALANIMYYAQVKGVGTCLWANGPLFIDKHRASRQPSGLQSNERVFGAMYMGYLTIKFHNKVSGKEMGVQWNGIV